MPLLAIESSGVVSSAALGWADDATARIELWSGTGQGQADRLIPLIEHLLAEHGVRYGDLDLLAVGIGPGSFTGVRTGIAAVRALALATGLQVIAITTFEALADAVEQAGDLPSMVVLDARRGQVYAQCFGPDRRAADDPIVATPERIAAALPRACRLIGDGGPLVARHVEGEVELIAAAPDAAKVAQVALARMDQGERGQAGFEIRPCYLRAPDALPMRPLLAPGTAVAGA